MSSTPSVRRALVVEDERPIRELLDLHLASAGYEVTACADGTTALARLLERPFDVVVLDVMLPGVDGVTLCRRARAEGPNRAAPILMVTARDGETDTVAGLESGADDYIAKPFGVRELLARVTAVTRRHARRETPATGPILARGALHIDVDRRAVTVRGEAVELTRQEFDVLHRLATRPGVVLSRAALLQAVWEDDAYVTERTVDTVISRLRRKIEQDPRDPELILTAWGIGYKFAD